MSCAYTRGTGMTYYETDNIDDNWFTIETGADIEQIVSDTCVCDTV